MLVIRLSRIGRGNLQKFRLVVQEKTASPKSGKVSAIIGHYDPRSSENKFVYEAEQIEKYLKNGAQPSDTVARLLLRNGFKKELVAKFIRRYTKQKSRKEQKAAAAEAEKKPAAAEKPSAEAPKDEPPAAEKPAEKPETAEQPVAEPKKEEKKAEKVEAKEPPAESEKETPEPPESAEKPAE